MDGPNYYCAAEKFLGKAESYEALNPRAMWCLQLAGLHTALAEVAATALGDPDGRAWFDVADTKLSG